MVQRVFVPDFQLSAEHCLRFRGTHLRFVRYIRVLNLALNAERRTQDGDI
jgi:hypothetical protein